MRSFSARQMKAQARTQTQAAIIPLPSARPKARIDAIDLARGTAIALMILSHGVKGLLAFEQIPDWGMVPVHLITKFSSSLFILVFGISLAVAHLPAVGRADWPARRKRLLSRGLVVLFWYKALTVLEMTLTMEGDTHLYTRADVLSALTYQAFPVYVEILGFYAIALLWVPFALPLWKRAPLAARVASVAVIAAVATLLQRHFDFWGIAPLKALLVEEQGYYTWGQLARAPLVLAGLLLGEWILRSRGEPRSERLVTTALAAAGISLLAVFYLRAAPDAHQALSMIAYNQGKHPPESQFMLFSVGGALLILAFTLLGGRRLASVFRPITALGKNALQAFVIHIVVLFVFFRYLFEYWRDVSYPHALALTFALLALSYLWVESLRWIRKNS